MTIGDPYARDAAVSGRSAVPLHCVRSAMRPGAGTGTFPQLAGIRYRRGPGALPLLVLKQVEARSSWARLLTAAGIGTIGTHSDVVEVSNPQRQLLHGEASRGSEAEFSRASSQ